MKAFIVALSNESFYAINKTYHQSFAKQLKRMHTHPKEDSSKLISSTNCAAIQRSSTQLSHLFTWRFEEFQ